MKKPITIGVIAVIVTILVTSSVDYSAIGAKPQPPPPSPEITESTYVLFQGKNDATLTCENGSMTNNMKVPTTSVSPFRGLESINILDNNSVSKMNIIYATGTLQDGSFELKGVVASDSTGCNAVFVPSSFTVSGQCGLNSLVTLQTEYGTTVTFTTNVGCA